MRKGKWCLLALHYFIILNFIVQIFYGAYQVFFVITASGAPGPLFSAARNMPFEKLVIRRLYAMETWIALVGLCIYLAITEIAPRLKRYDNP